MGVHMPSYRYTKDIKPEDLQPEKPPELDKKAKRKNWWHYHRKMVVLGLAALVMVGLLTAQVLMQDKPDLRIGLLVQSDLPGPVLTGLQDGIASVVGDLNGDGKAVVLVEVYTFPLMGEDAEMDMNVYSQMAGVVKLTSAMQMGDPIIFIAEPEQLELYQQYYEVFGTLDGQYAAPGTDPLELTVAYEDAVGLNSYPFEMEWQEGVMVDVHTLLADYRVGLRALYDTSLENDKNGPENWQKARSLLTVLLEGADEAAA